VIKKFEQAFKGEIKLNPRKPIVEGEKACKHNPQVKCY